MVDIAPVDPYQCLSRTIGYSVGLERLVDRVVRLVELYAESRELSILAFKDLVETGFGRRNAAMHFADFYAALGLVRIIGRDIHPLSNLEALSILRRYVNGDDSLFLATSKTILIRAVLEADGDVFLNGLASAFEPTLFRTALINMMKSKRRSISNVVRSPNALRKVYSVLDIKTQPSYRGQRDREAGSSARYPFTKRTEPLDLGKRTTHLSENINGEIVVPDDYLKKVSATRKGWAQDFSLFEKGCMTVHGLNLLAVLDKHLDVKQEEGCYVLWPYSRDLRQLQIRSEDIGAPEMTPWDLICAVAESVGDTEVEGFDESRDYSEVVAQLKEFHRLYREGNTVYGSIRHQLPLYIAEPCAVALCAAAGQPIPPLPAIIDAENRRPFRRINRIVISGTEGGLVFSE